MTGSTVISCGPEDAGNTAQSSPIPNGETGDARPSQRRIATISFSSPSAETDSAGRFVSGFTGSKVDLGQDEHERVQIKKRVGNNAGADAAGAFVSQRK